MANKSVLVTLADKNYIQQAKALFSEAYWNAGWQGDYLLLAHEIPELELKWFRRKGIIVYKCKPLTKDKTYGIYSSCMLSKAYLFKRYFKKWKKIIYLDADVYIERDFKKMKEVSSIGAIPDVNGFTLADNFKMKKNCPSTSDLIKNYALSRPAFNAGILAIDTKSINPKDFQKFLKLARKYKTIAIWGDQGIINLLLYKRWEELAPQYNIYANYTKEEYLTDLMNTKGVLYHFCGRKSKPWKKSNPFYIKWKSSLDKSEFIDINKKKRFKFTKHNKKEEDLEKNLRIRIKIAKIVKKISLKSNLKKIDKKIGQIGKLIKKKSPSLYSVLKRKNGK